MSIPTTLWDTTSRKRRKVAEVTPGGELKIESQRLYDAFLARAEAGDPGPRGFKS